MAENETQTAGTPRWVKAFAIIALVLVVLVVVVILVGRGGHGPGRHTRDDAPFHDAGAYGPSTDTHPWR
jgi:ABC-type transporter Mla subunit MlaD